MNTASAISPVVTAVAASAPDAALVLTVAFLAAGALGAFALVLAHTAIGIALLGPRR